MDVLVIIMGVIAVAVGVAGFISEHGGTTDSKQDEKAVDKTE
ncbi:MAG: hypothetical protein PUC55_03545 [Lachnospiraceae bacterium]|nr:hypothetical protein [Lachnospiraceae bacterium]